LVDDDGVLQPWCDRYRRLIDDGLRGQKVAMLNFFAVKDSARESRMCTEGNTNFTEVTKTFYDDIPYQKRKFYHVEHDGD
jgi:hypothetical protein